MKKIKISFWFLALFIFSLFLPASDAQALIRSSFSIPSPVSAMNDILNNLGVNQGEMRSQIQTLNVARRKKPQPQVRLDFYPPNPVEGEGVVAVATPLYFFNNNSDDLYFTWLLRRGSDDDGDVNDWKIAASRIIGNGNGAFDWSRDDSTTPDPGDDPLPYASHNDDDGYEAPCGGDDQRGKECHCYIHDNETGDEFMFPACEHLFPDDGIDALGGADGGAPAFGMLQEIFWHTDPNNNDTAGTNRPDEANVLGRGIDEFKWFYTPGDEVGVVVEGISLEPTQFPDSSYKVMWAVPNNQCDLSDFIDLFGFTFEGVDYTNGGQCEPNVPCLIEGEPELTILSTNINDPLGIGDTATSITVDPVNAAEWANTTLIRIDGTDNLTGGEVAGLTSLNGITMTVTRADGSTSHADGVVIYGNTISVQEDIERLITIDPNTNMVIVVDITTTTTCETDVLGNELPCESVTSPPVEVTFPYREFTMVVSDINDCLEDTLLAPSDVQEFGGKLKLNVTFSPQSPVNDTRDVEDPVNMSDKIQLTTSVDNVVNDDFLRYDWDVYTGDSTAIEDEGWDGPVAIEDLAEATPLSGIGVKQVSFKANFGGEPSFLKVRVTATEYDQRGGGRYLRKGNASVIIPLTNASDSLSVFLGTVADGADLVTPGASICTYGGNARQREESVICPILKHIMVGVSYGGDASQFQWTLDGTPLAYSQIFFAGQDPSEQSSMTYFPVLKEPGSIYTLRLSAVDNTDGSKISLVRTFKVVDPLVYIENDTNQILLGEYIPADGGASELDYSDTTFEAAQGSSVTFSLRLYPPEIPVTETTWYVDGTDPTDPLTPPGSTVATVSGDSVTVPVSKLPGDSYDISLSTLYEADENIKRILNQIWNVSFNEIYDAPLSANVELKVALPGLAAGKTAPKKFLAALYSGLPSYISFLFRIVLTAALLLLGSRLVFSFFPAPSREYYKNDK